MSSEALKRIDKMVERVARKAGYTGKENMTYKEILQAKFEQKKNKLHNKVNKYRGKLSLKNRNTDFSEEIRTYLKDGLVDLINEGYSEEEAIKITMDKFDEAELKNDFYDFINEFEGFGMENWNNHGRYSKKDEAIGLFYAAFTVLGMVIGAFSGFLCGYNLMNAVIGLVVGLFTGMGLGLLTHAFISLKDDK